MLDEQYTLVQIAARPCEVMFCCNEACWALDGTSVCEACMRSMSAMNSDNEDVFKPALGAIAKGAGRE